MDSFISISYSYSSLFLLKIIITLLVQNQSLTYKLSLLILLIKDGLPGPYLSNYSQVSNISYPLFLFIIIIKFPSIRGWRNITSMAFYIQSNCIKRAIFFTQIPLRQLQKVLYSFFYYTLQALLQLIQDTLSLGHSVVLYGPIYCPHFIYFLYALYIYPYQLY